jgi:uncharacterized protein YcaQ
MLELSLKEARRLMIGAQLLSGPPPKRPTKAKMLEVVQRSHHLVLWSRLGNHNPEWLTALHGKDRALFEYWVHAAAYAPIELFPYFRRDMLSFSESGWSGTRAWLENHPGILDRVIDHARANGPITTKSFDPPEGAERPAAWAWYGNKPTNLALDILWSSGVLMIDRRDKFQRVYDLTERVHPAWDDANVPTLEEERNALALTALRATGLMTARWLPDYFRTKWGHRSAVIEVLDNLVQCGHAVEGRVKGMDEAVYISTETLEKRFRPSRTTLLTPFDSLIWDRRRTRQMFDFEVTLEIYVPRDKRVYGYYSMPILYRDRLVGRLDPKAHRKTGELSINALHLEPWFIGKDDERFYAELATCLLDFSAFNGADHITVTACNPPETKARLEAALATASI